MGHHTHFGIKAANLNSISGIIEAFITCPECLSIIWASNSIFGLIPKVMYLWYMQKKRKEARRGEIFFFRKFNYSQASDWHERSFAAAGALLLSFFLLFHFNSLYDSNICLSSGLTLFFFFVLSFLISVTENGKMG